MEWMVVIAYHILTFPRVDSQECSGQVFSEILRSGHGRTMQEISSSGLSLFTVVCNQGFWFGEGTEQELHAGQYRRRYKCKAGKFTYIRPGTNVEVDATDMFTEQKYKGACEEILCPQIISSSTAIEKNLFINNRSRTFNTKLEIRCSYGFRFSKSQFGETIIVKCNRKGIWTNDDGSTFSITDLKCSKERCTSTSVVDTEMVVHTESESHTFDFCSIRFFTCRHRTHQVQRLLLDTTSVFKLYSKRGKAFCDASSKWTPVDGYSVCVKVHCPIISFMQNNILNADFPEINSTSLYNIQPGTVLNVTCQNKSKNIEGQVNFKITCDDSGEWKPTPTCYTAKCRRVADPNILPSFADTTEDADQGHQTLIQCKKDWAFPNHDVGENVSIECQPDIPDHWKHYPGRCKQVFCKPVKVKNAQINLFGRSRPKRMDEIRIVCEDGYQLPSGHVSQTITCLRKPDGLRLGWNVPPPEECLTGRVSLALVLAIVFICLLVLIIIILFCCWHQQVRSISKEQAAASRAPQLQPVMCFSNPVAGQGQAQQTDTVEDGRSSESPGISSQIESYASSTQVLEDMPTADGDKPDTQEREAKDLRLVNESTGTQSPVAGGSEDVVVKKKVVFHMPEGRDMLATPEPKHHADDEDDSDHIEHTPPTPIREEESERTAGTATRSRTGHIDKTTVDDSTAIHSHIKDTKGTGEPTSDHQKNLDTSYATQPLDTGMSSPPWTALDKTDPKHIKSPDNTEKIDTAEESLFCAPPDDNKHRFSSDTYNTSIFNLEGY